MKGKSKTTKQSKGDRDEGKSQKTVDTFKATEDRYRTLLENLPQKVFFKDRNFKWISINKNLAQDLNIEPAECYGKEDYDLFPKELADKYRADDIRIMDTGTTEYLEERYVQDGEPRIVATTKTAVKDENGNVVGVLGIFDDITERKQAEEELKKHREQLEAMVQERTEELTRQSDIIQQQAQEILEISTPVLQVQEGILVAPLIGALDSQRTQKFMDQLLGRIVETNSTVALVDITAVPVIDTQTAQHLIDTINAVKLLGARMILTGVRPVIAQTLVHLGIDLTGVMTCSGLSAGIRMALEQLDLKIVKTEIDEKKGA